MHERSVFLYEKVVASSALEQMHVCRAAPQRWLCQGPATNPTSRGAPWLPRPPQSLRDLPPPTSKAVARGPHPALRTLPFRSGSPTGCIRPRRPLKAARPLSSTTGEFLHARQEGACPLRREPLSYAGRPSRGRGANPARPGSSTPSTHSSVSHTWVQCRPAAQPFLRNQQVHLQAVSFATHATCALQSKSLGYPLGCMARRIRLHGR